VSPGWSDACPACKGYPAVPHTCGKYGIADPSPAPSSRPDSRQLEERLERIEQAIRTMARWLVEAQTGFNLQDARGIEDILDGKGGQENPDIAAELHGLDASALEAGVTDEAVLDALRAEEEREG